MQQPAAGEAVAGPGREVGIDPPRRRSVRSRKTQDGHDSSPAVYIHTLGRFAVSRQLCCYYAVSVVCDLGGVYRVTGA